MGLTAFALRNRTVTVVLTLVFLVGGLYAFQGLSRLEDPEFTIKTALVITPYPGATAQEVEEEVTDELELAVQKLGQLDDIESRSSSGMSTVWVNIRNNYSRDELPQVWDELRRKVSDAQGRLPPGAGPSQVIDDYGDVYGIFLAIHGGEYSYADLDDFVRLLRRELVLVQDVARVEVFGLQPETVYIEFNRDRMTQAGISQATIARRLQNENIVTNTGRVRVGRQWISLEPSAIVNSVDDLGEILISGGGNEAQIRLRDLATLRRGYREPATQLMRFDGKAAIGVGISTVPGGNVVTMGEAVRERLAELREYQPLGMEIDVISYQSDSVTVAINDFLGNLIAAVVIVIVVLLFFMGLRSGLIIGFILVLTIAGTFIFLDPVGVALERISLGALIIALGMLVDNAIVVVDGILIAVKKGETRLKAAQDVTQKAAIPLLGATIIAILAFAAIGTSDDSTGEFCRSLFTVVLISLGLSWFTAVTVTPLLCVWLIPDVPSADGTGKAASPYDTPFYRTYRRFLTWCIARRWLTVSVVVGLFAISLLGFGLVKQSFFPDSSRPQFLMDYWLPEGTHIEDTARDAADMEAYIRSLDGVNHVASMVGQGALRFMLTYTPESANPAYTQFLIDVDDYQRIDGLIADIEGYVREHRPQALAFGQRIALGPSGGGKIAVRLSGPDTNVLRQLEDKVTGVFIADGQLKGIRSDWRQRVPQVIPVISEQQAQAQSLSSVDVAQALRANFEGLPVGVYREGDNLLPIVFRAGSAERNVENIRRTQIWSPAAQTMIPLSAVLTEVQVAFDDQLIWRRDRTRTLTVEADPMSGPASVAFTRLRPQVEALAEQFPPGYSMEWGGEYENSKDAQEAIAGSVPVFVLAMILIVVMLFNNLRQTLVIWLCVPLALIGVTWGLVLTGAPFGFMALLGFLSLSGMLIKNAIVLNDEINYQRNQGVDPFEAVIGSGISRLRPVAMAAATTILGLLPLFTDPFYVSMAVTIVGGLLVATVLTMVVVPVFYAIVYRVYEKPVVATSGASE